MITATNARFSQLSGVHGMDGGAATSRVGSIIVSRHRSFGRRRRLNADDSTGLNMSGRSISCRDCTPTDRGRGLGADSRRTRRTASHVMSSSGSMLFRLRESVAGLLAFDRRRLPILLVIVGLLAFCLRVGVAATFQGLGAEPDFD